MKSTAPRNFNAIPSSIIDKTLIENNENYNLLVQNRQYTILNQLDNSIDLNRFKIDDEYRRLTILGLFMCDNPSFDYGEQLAIKYNISVDECHHTYFEYLLTNSNLSLNEIRKKIKPFLSSEKIKKNRQIKLDLVKKLHSNVFPFIDGKDHERLKLFYDIKKSLGDLKHAQKHVQAIQQLTTILNQGKKLVTSNRFYNEWSLLRTGPGKIWYIRVPTRPDRLRSEQDLVNSSSGETLRSRVLTDTRCDSV